MFILRLVYTLCGEIGTALKVEVGGTYKPPHLKFYIKFNVPSFVTNGSTSLGKLNFILNGMNFESRFLSAFKTRLIFYHMTHRVPLLFTSAIFL
jgi:hypothetical protein